MRAFLAADSCPSLRRRPTSCSSWAGKGSYKPASPTSNAIVHVKALSPRKTKVEPRLRASLPILLNLPRSTAGVKVP